MTLVKDDTVQKMLKKTKAKTRLTENHIPQIRLPQRLTQTVHYHYTHRSSALPGVFHPCL